MAKAVLKNSPPFSLPSRQFIKNVQIPNTSGLVWLDLDLDYFDPFSDPVVRLDYLLSLYPDVPAAVAVEHHQVVKPIKLFLGGHKIIKTIHIDSHLDCFNSYSNMDCGNYLGRFPRHGSLYWVTHNNCLGLTGKEQLIAQKRYDDFCVVFSDAKFSCLPKKVDLLTVAISPDYCNEFGRWERPAFYDMLDVLQRRLKLQQVQKHHNCVRVQCFCASLYHDPKHWSPKVVVNDLFRAGIIC